MNRAKNILSRSSRYAAVTVILLAVFGFGLATTNNAQAAKENSDNEAMATPAFTEGFEDVSTLPGKGWFSQNNSSPLGPFTWGQGVVPPDGPFTAQAGPPNSYIVVNYQSTGEVGTISDWLLTPVIEFRNGDVITFYTRTTSAATFPDRLEVRLSTNGSSTNVGTGPTSVGDFTTKLLTINESLVAGPSGGYPVVWTQFTITISGLSAPTNGRLAFRYFVTDGGTNGANSNIIGIDTFSYTPAPTGVVRDAPVDFNGDGRTDYAVVRNVGGASGSGGSPANQLRWFYNFNVAPPIPATQARDWGLASDVVLTEDFDGDIKDDIAVWRPGASGIAAFYILNSATNTARIEQFGLPGDNPKVVGDYDGDNKADVAVYRPGATAGAQSTWLYRTTPGGATNFIVWGRGDDLPVPGDYDGDGKHDFVIQRNNGDGRGQFWTRLATGATTTPVRVFGLINDFIAPGDYDGDGKTDLAVVRISGGAYQWHWRRSSDSVEVGPITFGVAATDLLAPGDYDGDGTMDIAVWRRTGGLFISRSTVSGATSFFQLGADGDFPVAGYNLHFRPLIL